MVKKLQISAVHQRLYKLLHALELVCEIDNIKPGQKPVQELYFLIYDLKTETIHEIKKKISAS